MKPSTVGSTTGSAPWPRMTSHAHVMTSCTLVATNASFITTTVTSSVPNRPVIIRGNRPWPPRRNNRLLNDNNRWKEDAIKEDDYHSHREYIQEENKQFKYVHLSRGDIG
jgi:hypothetical protein